MNDILEIEGPLPLESPGAGIMISRGTGRHVKRIAAHFTLIFVIQGVLYVEEDGHEFVVQAGETLLLWPGRLHQGTREYERNLQFFWLHFTPEPFQKGTSTLHIAQQKRVIRPEFITELFRRFLDDLGSGFVQPLGAALYTWMILLEVARNGSPEGGAQAALARRVDTYIRAHHHEHISAIDIGRALGYNSQYLARIYRQAYGRSLAGALRRIRINHAKFLLMNTNHNLKDISHLVGFDDTSYFQRVFKQLEGITPAQFRNLHSHINIHY